LKGKVLRIVLCENNSVLLFAIIWSYQASLAYPKPLSRDFDGIDASFFDVPVDRFITYADKSCRFGNFKQKQGLVTFWTMYLHYCLVQAFASFGVPEIRFYEVCRPYSPELRLARKIVY